MIHTGDCLTVMAGMADASVDAVVTDPPAGIGFMGKGWDHHRGGRQAWVDWMTEVMRECYRLLKPGAHVLVWALPRTSHWTGWAIESAGFEMRDKLIHAFASGFPKSHNLPGGLGTALKPAYEDWWLARKPLSGTVAANVLAHGTGALSIDATRIGSNGGLTRHTASNGEHRDRWEGNTATGEVTEHGGRWPANVILTDPVFDGGVDGVVGGGIASDSGWTRAAPSATDLFTGVGGVARENYVDSGTYSRFFLIPKADRAGREPPLRADTGPYEHSGPRGHTLNGDGTARATSRPRANVHPTVKPIELMRHLVRLVTPPGGLVLDPFLGSGTTAIACEMEGFAWIGVEKEAEYVAIAEARLNGVQRGLGLDVPAPSRPWKDYPTATRYPVKGPSQSSWFTDSDREEEPA